MCPDYSMKDITLGLEEQLVRKGYRVITPIVDEFCLAEYSSDLVQELRTLRITEVKEQDPDMLISVDTEFYACLVHPSIPEFKESFLLDDFHITAKQHVTSNSLSNAIARGKTIVREPQGQKLLEDILLTLDFAHQRSICHGNINPAFIYLREKAYLDFYPNLGSGTESDDLYALGYTLLGAMLGQDKHTISKKLKSKHLKDIHSYSAKFGSFMEKLIHEQRGYRYQSAGQALEDLHNLDNFGERELRKRVDSVIHRPQVQALLEKLATEDPYYDYNVPELTLNELYDDSLLIEYLRKTYSQTYFKIANPNWINKLLQIGDKVVKKGTFSNLKKQVDQREEGLFLELKGENAKVRFKNLKLELPLTDFEVIGKRDFGTIAISPIRADKFTFDPVQQYLVRYLGETKYFGEAVLDQTPGLVFSAHPIYIVWEQNDGAKQIISQRIFGGVTSRKYTSKDIVLMRKNEVDFEVLYKQCFSKK